MGSFFPVAIVSFECFLDHLPSEVVEVEAFGLSLDLFSFSILRWRDAVVSIQCVPGWRERGHGGGRGVEILIAVSAHVVELAGVVELLPHGVEIVSEIGDAAP